VKEQQNDGRGGLEGKGARRGKGEGASPGRGADSLVSAEAVMENTDHHLFVGKGALTFARQLGFPIEDDLNTPNSRERWLEWKRRIGPKHHPDPIWRSRVGYEVGREIPPFSEGVFCGRRRKCRRIDR
jgi:N4-(beta-N-acetylglucosaminyl)-L-asparaginase